MSQPSPFRRWAAALVLAAAGVASIATSPPPRLEARLESAAPFTLTAEQPTLTQRLRVRLELDEGLEGSDASAMLLIDGRAFATVDEVGPDAGTADAGGTPDERPRFQLVVRDAAHPEAELGRGDNRVGLDLMRDCAQRSCEQTLILEWSLAEGSAAPISVTSSFWLDTGLDPDDGVATVELVP